MKRIDWFAILFWMLAGWFFVPVRLGILLQDFRDWSKRVLKEAEELGERAKW